MHYFVKRNCDIQVKEEERRKYKGKSKNKDIQVKELFHSDPWKSLLTASRLAHLVRLA